MLNTKFSPWPSFTTEEAKKIKEILMSNKVNYWTGNECREFEKEFANFTESKYAIALSNGTVALDLAISSLGLGKGDEIIVTSRTFIASVSSIVNSGAVPIFCDVCKNSQNLDVKKIPSLITKKTKAIMCVHLAGWPCDMDEIINIAKKNKLFVIEDCAQAHGAKYKGKSVGSKGDIGCWSFCQDKIMTTGGEGGMVTTNNKNLWEKMWSYKDHGKSFDAVYKKKHAAGFKWLHKSFGTNFRMTEIQAAIGRIQLKRMPDWTAKRNNNQNIIWDAANEINALRVPEFEKKTTSIHGAYKCYIFIKTNELKRGWNRDKIIAKINQKGVPCASGSCSEVYLEEAFNNTKFRPKKRLKVAKDLGETSIVFLIHPSLTKEELRFTCSTLTNVMRLASK